MPTHTTHTYLVYRQRCVILHVDPLLVTPCAVRGAADATVRSVQVGGVVHKGEEHILRFYVEVDQVS